MSNDDLFGEGIDDLQLRVLLGQVAAELRGHRGPTSNGPEDERVLDEPRLARIRERLLQRLLTPEQAARHRAFARALTELSPSELSARLREAPELASPTAVSALLDRARAALANGTQTNRPEAVAKGPAPAQITPADRAVCLAEIATDVAYRISPVLHEVTLRLDALAEAQIVLALAHLAASRELAARHALSLALALLAQGTGDPLLATEAQITEGFLARLRGDQGTARLALRLAAERYETFHETDGAEITWSLFTELLPRRRWTSDEPAASAIPQAHRFAHFLAVWRHLSPADPLAEGSTVAESASS